MQTGRRQDAGYDPLIKGHPQTRPITAPADFDMGATVASCEAAVRQGFLRKVFGLVAMQLAITAGMCALAMYEPHTQEFILASPQLMMISIVASFGCARHAHKPITATAPLLNVCHALRRARLQSSSLRTATRISIRPTST